MTKADLDHLYSLLDQETPLTDDCGRLCGGACCREDDGETLSGVDLLPIEAEALADAEWGTVVEDPITHRPMLMCSEPCERSRRPWLCRVFPLCPVDGGKRVRIDARSRAVCPLSRYGLKGLLPEFKKAVSKSCVFLCSFEDGQAFAQEWEEGEAKFREPLW